MYPARQYIPQTGTNRGPVAVWLLMVLGSVFILALILGAPVALLNGYESLAHTIYRTFSYVCHQIPERSLTIAGRTLAVCSRCTGIYSGFSLATMIYPLVWSLRRIDAPPRKWLFLAATPLAIDFALEFFGIWHNTHTSRLVTGVLLGSVAVFYVIPGLVDLSLRPWKPSRTRAGANVDEATVSNALSSNVSGAPSDYSAPHRRI